MSKQDRPDNSEPQPDVLDENIGTLLKAAHGDAPRLDDLAKAKLRAQLVAAHGKPKAAPGKRRYGMMVGAAVALAAAATLLWLQPWALLAGKSARDVGASQSGAGVAGGAKLESDAAGTQTVRFADGSTALVQPGGKVEALGPRQARVSGVAFFDVVPGATPFVVRGERGHIAVLGTQFVVDSRQTALAASVLRGVVDLRGKRGNVRLHAGERGELDATDTPVRKPAPRLSQLASWLREAGFAAAQRVGGGNGTLFARWPNSNAAEQPLPMTQFKIDVVVENKVARVALDQTFYNPMPYEQEGMYRFAIPSDAALQRFAMYVDGTLMEAAVVERMAARRIYEDLVYRRIDPGLMEYAGAGRLAMKVYPLRAKQDKRLLVAYTQTLASVYDTWTLRIPVPTVDGTVADVGFAALLRGCANCEITSPTHPVTVTRDGADATARFGLTHAKLGDAVVLHVRQSIAASQLATFHDGADVYSLVRAPIEAGTLAASYQPRNWVLLHDVSSSRDAIARQASAEVIAQAAAHIDEDDVIAVVAVDVEPTLLLPATKARDIDRKQLRSLLASANARGDGATDLGKALAMASKLFPPGSAQADNLLVYVGDGVATFGERTVDKLLAQLADRAQFIGVGLGDGIDTTQLGLLASATGGMATSWDFGDDLGWRTFDLIATLHTSRIGNITAQAFDANGAALPAQGYVQAQLADGDELVWIAKSSAVPARLVVSGTQAGVPWQKELTLRDGRQDAGYLPRVWAQRHIAQLHANKQLPPPPCVATAPCEADAVRREARDEALRREIVTLGKRYYLLSRHTSLLVLDSDQMYAKYEVVKGSGQTWAPYVLPAKLAPSTTAATTAAPAAPDQASVPPEATRASMLAELPRYKAAYMAGPGQVPFGGGVGFRDEAFELGGGRAEAGFSAPEASERAGDAIASAQPSAGNDSQAQQDLVGMTFGGFEDKAKSEAPMASRSSAAWGSIGLGRVSRRAPGPRAGMSPVEAARGLFFDELALLQRQVVHVAGMTREPGALALLAKARTQLVAGNYRIGATRVGVTASGLDWQAPGTAGIEEQAAWREGSLLRAYPELGVAVTRDADPLTINLTVMPWWFGDADRFAHDCGLALASPNTVAVTPPGQATPRWEYRFDDQGKLLEVLEYQWRVVAIKWAGSVPTAITWGGRTEAVEPISQAVPAPSRAGFAVVALPLAPPHVYATQLAAAAASAPAAQVTLLRQQLASSAMYFDSQGGIAALKALLKINAATQGDWVLAAGLIQSNRNAGIDINAAPPAVANYLRAVQAQNADAVLALTGSYRSFAIAAAASAARKPADFRTAVNQIPPSTGALRETASVTIALALPAKQQVDYWLSQAEAELTNQALLYAVYAAMYTPRYQDVLATYFEKVNVAGEDVGVFHHARAALTSPKAAVALDGAVARALSTGRVESLLALAVADETRSRELLERAWQLADGDAAAMLQVAHRAAAIGLGSWQLTKLPALQAQFATQPHVQRFVGRNFAMQQRWQLAIAPLQAGLAGRQPAAGDDRYFHDLSLLVQALTGAGLSKDIDDAPARIIAVSKQLRETPAGRDLVTSSLLRLGATSDALRQLTIAVDQDPYSGQAWSVVAQFWVNQGEHAAAVPYWHQAVIVDQTNPTWRFLKAKSLAQAGDVAGGKALVEQTLKQKWHQRFEWELYDMRQWLRSTK